MVEAEFTVGLVISRHAPVSIWGEPLWVPSQVLEGVPAAPPWTVLSVSRERTSYFVGAFTVRLYSTDTAAYRDNLTSGEPKLWVVMRPLGPEPPVEIVQVTADPTEGEGATQTGSNVVGVVEMPPGIAAQIAQFVTEHHVERVFEKRTRDKSQPRGRRGA